MYTQVTSQAIDITLSRITYAKLYLYYGVFVLNNNNNNNIVIIITISMADSDVGVNSEA